MSLSTDQRTVLTGAFLALIEGIQFDHAICAQEGYMKVHLMKSLAKFGYTIYEGSVKAPTKADLITWDFVENRLSSARVRALDHLPQTSRTKGDLKVLDPAVFFELKCYPNFGSKDPKLSGRPAEKMMKDVNQVINSESHAWLFVVYAGAYDMIKADLDTSLTTKLPTQADICTHPSKFSIKHNEGADLALLITKVSLRDLRSAQDEFDDEAPPSGNAGITYFIGCLYLN